MMTTSETTSTQRLAQALLSAWSSGDRREIAATLEGLRDADAESSGQREMLELLQAIGARMQSASSKVDRDDLRVAVKLLRHFARS